MIGLQNYNKHILDICQKNIVQNIYMCKNDEYKDFDLNDA
jgi:hypothetical protein